VAGGFAAVVDRSAEQLAHRAQEVFPASCPLVTGYGRLILAEFGYDGRIMESFPGACRIGRWVHSPPAQAGMPPRRGAATRAADFVQ